MMDKQEEELTRGLRVITLISGISKLDLRTETQQRHQHPAGRTGSERSVRRLSLVVWSFCPQRFDILRRQKQFTGQFLRRQLVSRSSAYMWFCEWVVAVATVTFLMSSVQLQALISPFPALKRWQSVDSRQKTGPSWAEREQRSKVNVSSMLTVL